MVRLMHAAAAVVLCLIAAPSARAQEVDAVVKKIRSTGAITMGYRENIPPTGFLDENKKPSGYSVEFCQRIIQGVAKELGVPEIKINYVPVTLQTRQALVANGTVDLECGGTVNTYGRNKQVDFTWPTYVAASQLLVLKGSPVHDFKDLNGKVVAVATSGSNEPEIRHIIETQKLNIRVLPVEDHPAGLAAVESKRADAYFSDNSAFLGLIKNSRHPENLEVVGAEYGFSPQGFMIPKLNPAFKWIVDREMARMFKSGEAEKLFDKWFGPFGLHVGPKLRAAWETASMAE